MILSHVASSCFNMSPYRAIWTHFKFILMIPVQVLDLVLVLDPVQVQILDQVQDLIL